MISPRHWKIKKNDEGNEYIVDKNDLWVMNCIDDEDNEFLLKCVNGYESLEERLIATQISNDRLKIEIEGVYEQFVKESNKNANHELEIEKMNKIIKESFDTIVDLETSNTELRRQLEVANTERQRFINLHRDSSVEVGRLRDMMDNRDDKSAEILKLIKEAKVVTDDLRAERDSLKKKLKFSQGLLKSWMEKFFEKGD